jgi:hypothetical protein
MIIAERLVRRYDTLKTEKGTLESHLQEIAKYCIPRKAYITREVITGQKFDIDIYDSTAAQAALVLSAGLHSYLTNPSSKWFSIRTQEEELMNDHSVKTWIKDCEDRIYDALNGSNFAQQIHEGYLDLVIFGTACIYEDEDFKDMLRFYTRPIQEYVISEGADERVDTVIRKFKLTTRQAYEMWGKAAGEEVTNAYEKQDYDKPVFFLHAVCPRGLYDQRKADAVNMPYASYYIEYSKKHMIAEGGYREFPYFVPRFSKESGEVWGTSPAFVSLPDIKMLNLIAKTLIRAGQKIVDPPLVLPNDAFLLPIKVDPAALNFRLTKNTDDKIEALQTEGNIPVGEAMAETRRIMIKRNFYVDLFLMLENQSPDMTATEVMQRVQEKMLILAPTLGRLMNELLDPIIDRSFRILARNGQFAPAPQVLAGKEYSIEYVSPLAKAQKMQDIQSVQQFLALVGQMAQFKADALDKINIDKVIDDMADMYKAPPNIINDDKTVEAIRAERAQVAQAQQKMMMLQQGASAAKDMAGAEKEMKGEPVPA